MLHWPGHHIELVTLDPNYANRLTGRLIDVYPAGLE
jgi:hypothetical protein